MKQFLIVFFILNIFWSGIFSWVWTNSPTLVVVGGLMSLTWWVSGRFFAYRSRFVKTEEGLVKTESGLVKVEADCAQLKNGLEQVKNSQEHLKNGVDQLRNSQEQLKVSHDQLKVSHEQLKVSQDQLKVSQDQLKNSIDQLKNSQDHLKRSQAAQEKRLDSIDRKLAALIDYLTPTGKIGKKLLGALSPIGLTETGAKILAEMGGKAYVDMHWSSLLTSLESQSFKSALDVQNYCILFLWGKKNDDEWIPIRNYLFNHPEYKLDDNTFESLDLSVAVHLTSIYLRDRYFEVHPELRDSIQKT